MEVASPYGFARNPSLVLDFYNQRRRQLLEVVPNPGHKMLAELERHFNVTVITQNVDDLHERAGSSNVFHLHGELLKVRSTGDETIVLDWKKDLTLGETCPKGYQLRPHIVWFGEEVPLLSEAAQITVSADILIIIGTSMQVYPAAGLLNYARQGTPIYFIDPKPSINASDFENLTIIQATAAKGVPTLVTDLVGKEL